MITRLIQESILEILKYFPVVGIIGPRQVGKTTLAKSIIKEIKEKESIYIDLENPKDLAKLTDPVLFFERNIDKCIVLDEIQRFPNLFPILRSMVDLKRINARFIILGSASPNLIRDSSESLAGRIAYEELTPFNLIEIAKTKELLYHWQYGGFPDAFTIKNIEVKQKWYANFIQTYIERDLPMLGLNIDRESIRKLWLMVAHIHGDIINMNNLSKSLEVTGTTLKKYLAFLKDAFLIRLLPPYTMNIKKRLVKSPKIYVRDSGLLHHLLNIKNFDVLESHPILGNSWEGYVIEQIAQKIDVNDELMFYRTHEGAECDLVLTRSGKPYMAIEIKYTAAPKLSKGNNIAFGDIKAEMNYIITPGTDTYLISDNIKVCSLKYFLENFF